MFSAAYKRYALGAMTAVYMLTHVDRGLMILLLQPIKHDLELSDTQLGFVTGIAFGLFYAVLGLPFSRWADRGNRVSIAALAVTLWSLTVMSSLWVTQYFHLVLVRIAAAVGEAGAKPPTYSLVGDYFPQPAERTRAMAIYIAANPLTSLFSFAVGGWLNELVGWRMTFFIMGIPALLIALVVRLTIREPRAMAATREDARPALSAVIMVLWQRKACRHLGIGMVLLFTMSQGLAPWYAAFMMRSHGMGSAELGIWFSLIFGLGGLAGILGGGYVTSRWFGTDERTQLRGSAITVAAVAPLLAAFLLLPGKYAALLALTCIAVVLVSFLAPVYALLQRLVPAEMRATTLAVVMLFANLVGMGFGAQIVGVLSDLFAPTAGVDSLRYAMLIVSAVLVWAGWHFWQAGKTVTQDLAA